MPVSGLVPIWVHLTDLATGHRVTDPPEFEPLPGGQYTFSLRLESGQAFLGQVDLGPALVDGNDRFIDVYLEPTELVKRHRDE